MISPIPHSSPWIQSHDQAAVSRVLATGMIASDREVSAFESDVSRYLRGSTCLAQANGTMALLLALRALDVGVDDEVILPTYVCGSVLEAVAALGAKPALADVNEFGVLVLEGVAPLLTRKTKAIIAVHIFGHPCNINALGSFGVPVIEDACQAFGLELDGRMAGTLGALGIFSFHATKPITTGEGGMVVASDPVYVEAITRVAQAPPPHLLSLIGTISDLQASLGRSQLAHYPEFLVRRRQIKDVYAEGIRRIGVIPAFPEDATFLFRFTVRTPHAFAEIQARALESGFHVRRGVDQLLHRLCGMPDDAFPSAVRCFDETVSIPFYPALTDEEVSFICDGLAKVFP